MRLHSSKSEKPSSIKGLVNIIDTLVEMTIGPMEKSRPFANKKYFRHLINMLLKTDLYSRAFDQYTSILVENDQFACISVKCLICIRSIC